MDPQILTFVELFLFSFFVVGWAAWEYRSVSRLQKKTREEAAAAARTGPSAPVEDRSGPAS